METKNRIKAVRALISAAAVAALFATQAEAAVLTNVEGAVSVNHGNGYSPAGTGAALVPGDRVRTAKGSANIVYENGCSQRVEPNQIVAVLASPPPCDGASLKDSPGIIPAGFDVNPVIVGGLVVGGAVGLGVALSQNNHNAVSP